MPAYGKQDQQALQQVATPADKGLFATEAVPDTEEAKVPSGAGPNALTAYLLCLLTDRQSSQLRLCRMYHKDISDEFCQ